MKFAIVGKSLPHTISPRLHREFGNFEYGVKELEDENALKDFVLSHELLGYNVTIPYKQAVMPLLDEISESAREIGAVNTVVDVGGKLFGYNTDIDGVTLAMQSAGIDVDGKNVLVLGSGGTSKTVQYYLKKHGAKYSVVSRNGTLNYDNVYDMTDTEVIINTTPVGTMSIEKPIDLERFNKLEGVFDVIYNPIETALVRQARGLGVKATCGLGMLVEQGRIAHNIFAKVGGFEKQSEDTTFEIVKKLEDERRNIVLVGMAGCGKTTIGRQLAKRTQKAFVDLDEEIVKRTGKTIPQIFEEVGEAGFRKIESEVVAETCIKTGLVIATGGGAVLDEKNIEYFKANGMVLFLKRDVNLLARDGRPLSKDLETVKELYRKREPIYKKISDFEVKNFGDVKDVVDAIMTII